MKELLECSCSFGMIGLSDLESQEEIFVIARKRYFGKSSSLVAFLTRVLSVPMSVLEPLADELTFFSSDGRLFHVLSMPESTSRDCSSLRINRLVTLIKKVNKRRSTVGVLCVCDNEVDVFPFLSMLVRGFCDRDSLKSNAIPYKVGYCLTNPLLQLMPGKDYSVLVENLRRTCVLIDAPANFVTPDFLESLSRSIATEAKACIKVFSGTELVDVGLNGIYNVGKSSQYSPRMIILSNVPGVVDRKSFEAFRDGVALVGKGVTFDAGGLSLKSCKDMLGMKRDMSGVAVVLFAFLSLLQLGYNGRLYAILCVAENFVGKDAIRPGDVIKLYSGKTVEITNPDSEGRLLLADGVSYAESLNVAEIIDIGSLTSTQPLATGAEHGAVMSNDLCLEKLAVTSGKCSGDLVYSLLYCPEALEEEFYSEVADMKNSVDSVDILKVAYAAHFIEKQIKEKRISWLHCDMLGPSVFQGKATGFGMFLLVKLLLNQQNVLSSSGENRSKT